MRRFTALLAVVFFLGQTVTKPAVKSDEPRLRSVGKFDDEDGFPGWTTVPALAAELATTECKVGKLIASGELAAYRFGSAIRIRRADADKLVRSRLRIA